MASGQGRVDAVHRVAIVIGNRRVERQVSLIVRIRVIDRLGMRVVAVVVVMVRRAVMTVVPVGRVSPDVNVGCFVDGVVRSATVVGMDKCQGDPLIGHYQQDKQQIGKPTNHRSLDREHKPNTTFLES